MKIPPVKGTRDLYPDDLSPIRHIFNTWRAVSLRHGFDEYEGPTLEHLELYREKSGEELVGQLYRLTDSGGRELALRPEMTPTLARMVAARVHALPKPIKWFSIPTLFRGENVQRGRLREFYQWNVDVIGSADPVADAEVILVGVEALRALGLTADHFAVHISNRRLISAILQSAGIPADGLGAAFALLDKAGKQEAAEFDRRWDAGHGTFLSSGGLRSILAAPTLDAVGHATRAHGSASARDDAAGALESALAETAGLLGVLQDFGITEFCKLDLRVVRGLAYYTGPVFEFYDRGEKERAICGGGRYDDLLGKLGKSKEPAVGFGMGDVVLSLLLEERGLRPPTRTTGGVFVIDVDATARPSLYRVVAALRRAGIAAEFSYASQPVGKQLKTADKQGARHAVLVGVEPANPQQVRIKDMAGGLERDVAMNVLLDRPLETLGMNP